MEQYDWTPDSAALPSVDVRASQISKFPHQDYANFNCIPCLNGTSKRSPVRNVFLSAAHPIKEILLDISGPFEPTWDNKTYALHFSDSFTANSDKYWFELRYSLCPRGINSISNARTTWVVSWVLIESVESHGTIRPFRHLRQAQASFSKRATSLILSFAAIWRSRDTCDNRQILHDEKLDLECNVD